METVFVLSSAYCKEREEEEKKEYAAYEFSSVCTSTLFVSRFSLIIVHFFFESKLFPLITVKFT